MSPRSRPDDRVVEAAEATRGPGGEQALAALVELHREIDEAVAQVASRHAGRLRCGRGCAACCLDDLTVRPIEAERIRRRQGRLLREGSPHPPGACAFLDDAGACRIYEDRPSVCRSQGLPLRVLFEDEADEIAERRDICPLNLEGGPPLEALDETDCWLVGPHELRIAALDAAFEAELRPGSDASDSVLGAGADEPARVPLRSLFEASRGSDVPESSRASRPPSAGPER